jgi:hypothetical protein
MSLSQAEIAYALQVFAENARTNPIIVQRFQAATQAGEDPTSVQISEEDLEVLLDTLPAPSQEEHPTISSLRRAVQKALTSLRFGDQPAPTA